MARVITMLVTAFLTLSCASTPQNKLAEPNNFTFENYDFLVVKKSTSLSDIDIEFGDLMKIYNMKVITVNEYENMVSENQKRTLFTKIYLDNKTEKSQLIVLFKDSVTGEEKRSFSGHAEGDMYNSKDRSKALQTVSNKVIKELKEDKGLLANKSNMLAKKHKTILPGVKSNKTDVLTKSYIVTADTLNVRKAPVVGLDIIEKVKKGHILTKISSLLGWVKVELPSGNIGWVSMKYLQPIDESQ